MKPRKKYKKRALRLVPGRKNWPRQPAGVRAITVLSRWALTADGAFVDLASPGSDEIPQIAARALVAFIRTLDRGEAAA